MSTQQPADTLSLNKTERCEYADIAKSIAIYLVILGHTLPDNTSLKVVIYSFHMPLFFIISGFFIKNSEITFGQYHKLISKKFFALIVPYLLWGAIYMSLDVKNMLFLVYGSWKTIMATGGLSSLWFLPVLFIATGIINSFRMSTIFMRHKTLCCIMAIVLLFTVSFITANPASLGKPWCLDISCMAAGYMLLGGALFRLHKRYKRVKTSIITFILALLGFTISTLLFSTGNDIGYMRMADGNYGIWYICLINASLGSMAVISLSQLLVYNRIICNILMQLGKYTLGIFLIHKFLINIIYTLIEHLHLENINTITTIFLSIAIIISSYYITIFLEKYIPQLYGKF